jgi:hypothetical protein
MKRPKINKLWGSYCKFHLAHPILIRPVELQRRNIIELQKIKFHTQKGRNFGDIVEERLSSRTISKSRFKSDTWPTCHPKKGNSTPNKPLENPTWNLDEGEEMSRDINDLQKNIVTNDELQEMESKLEAKMDGFM